MRLVVPNRPGIGGSAFLPNRRILDWFSDVLTLADTLGIERFAVAGVSGGGPYALACALSIPQRLTAVASRAVAERGIKSQLDLNTGWMRHSRCAKAERFSVWPELSPLLDTHLYHYLACILL